MKQLDYDITTGIHRPAEEEWAPHRAMAPDFFEWHYFTAPLTGANGHQYFLFLCDFNASGEGYQRNLQVPAGTVPYINQFHICDYTTNLFKGDFNLMMLQAETIFEETTNTLNLKDPASQTTVEFRYQGDSVSIYAKTDIFECNLICSGANQVMWMQDSLGKEGFIREGAINDRSFYYSLPRLPFHGWLKYTEQDGREITVDVFGQGWVDRQWGNFFTNTWEWTSFRFGDGDRLNTYNFAGGYQVCTYQTAEGITTNYPEFKVIQNGYLRTPMNNWVSWGWDYVVPVKDGFYKLIPLSDKNIILNGDNTFFEGLSKVMDKNGELVGWAVTESMDIRKMQNSPYDIYNNFPES